jgi:hypothetical protein
MLCGITETRCLMVRASPTLMLAFVQLIEITGGGDDPASTRKLG